MLPCGNSYVNGRVFGVFDPCLKPAIDLGPSSNSFWEIRKWSLGRGIRKILIFRLTEWSRRATRPISTEIDVAPLA